MEMKGEFEKQRFLDIDYMDEKAAYLLLKKGSYSVLAPHTPQQVKRPQSFELPRRRNMGKLTKSMSDQFVINVDKLTGKVSIGGSEETSSPILSQCASSELSFSSLTQYDDSKRVHNCSQKTSFGFLLSVKAEGKEMEKCSEAESENPEPCSWSKMNMEPTLPIYLKFEDVRYMVKGREKEYWSSGAEKCILQGISGIVNPGEVLALMGPSGGGKTTLLNILSGRVKNSNTTTAGTITYNDQPYNKSLKRRIGFVFQDDIVFPHLTVKETLTYSALLRLPTSLTKQQKKERAMDVIGEIGLQRCQDTIIGGNFVRGISGGERKRVCIGNEILLNPSLLFLDEPTSGLDSTTALQIVQMLHNIAKVGKTVVATIHQPSSRVFTKFDNLILLGKGNTLYSGKASEAMLYFSSIGCSPRIALNPAEFLIDLANGNMKDTSVPSELEDKSLVTTSPHLYIGGDMPSPGDVHEFLVGAYASRVAKMRKAKHWKPLMVDENGENNDLREWGAPWWEQFSILFRRGFKERRHESLSSVRIIQVISTALIIGLLWWHTNSSSPSGLDDQAGLLFFISVFWGFFPLFTAIFTFPQERAMLVKERSVDMYKLSAYLLARNISDLPLDLILPTLFLLILYFMVGFKSTFLAFFFTLLTIFLSIIASQGLGLTIGAAFMEVKKATTFASITVMTFMLSGGFFIQKVPSFMSWIRYISFNYHTYRLLLKIQYNSNTSGEKVGSGGFEVGAMLLMVVGYRILAYLFLRRMKLRTIF